MIRLASIADLQCLRQLNRPRVQRPADNRPLNTLGFELTEGAQVLQAGDAPRGDDPEARLARQTGGGLQIRAAERAIAGNVGVDGPLNPLSAQPATQGHSVYLGDLAPTADGDAPIARVDAGHDALGAETRQRVRHQMRVIDDGGAQNGAADPHVEQPRKILSSAQTPAELHRYGDTLQDGTQRPQVDGACLFVAERTVEVHHVQPGGSEAGPASGHGGRIVAKDGLCLRVPLVQTHAATSAQVDSRKEDHACPTRVAKLRRMVRPTS